MRVKRYVVDSMPDALQRIRSELGNDAVILSTKDIRSGGFLGMFGKKKIEVIAATDTSENKSKVITKPITTVRSGTVPARSAAMAYANAPVGQATMPFVPDVVPAEELVLVNHASTIRSGTAVQSENKDSWKPPVVNNKVVQQPPVMENELMEEIRQMKQMMRTIATGQIITPFRHPVLDAWKDKLADQDILPVVIEDIISSVEVEMSSSTIELTDEWVDDRIRERLKLIVTGRGGTPIKTDVKIINFVGPTGVGKTTTIAKLAADQVLKSHRKVGLITSDTYRIAAVEQLKTYATILNIPLEVVFSPADLHKAFEQMQTCDLIFMDTAGRNYRNEMYVSELNALLSTKGNSETILVMSLTNKYRDMKVIAENFSKFGVEKVLFTKMDETASCGSIINLLYEYPLRLSYMTDGQNVPEDISLLTEIDLVARVMGERFG
ncbi:MAG: flagellar biosynthesis protein FlhF [Gorillibacterium sp.]|nr:flagellar biosynthesis protein FlhF [Gorillibacterium sp.]